MRYEHNHYFICLILYNSDEYINYFCNRDSEKEPPVDMYYKLITYVKTNFTNNKLFKKKNVCH